MTTQAQNEAIAKAIGVKFHHPTEEEIKSGSYYQYEPDYTRDLNAMHSAEKWLEQDIVRRNRYANELHNLDIPTPEFFRISATAAQRAEAFLKTLGLWIP